MLLFAAPLFAAPLFAAPLFAAPLFAALPGLNDNEISDEDNAAQATQNQSKHLTAPSPFDAFKRSEREISDCPYRTITAENYPGYTPDLCKNKNCKLPFNIRHFLIAACRAKGDGTVSHYQGPNGGSYFKQLGIENAEFHCDKGLLSGKATFNVKDASLFPYADLGIWMDEQFYLVLIYEKTRRIVTELKSDFLPRDQPSALCRNAPALREGFVAGLTQLLQEDGKTVFEEDFDSSRHYEVEQTTTLHTQYRKNWERDCALVNFAHYDDHSMHGKFILETNGLQKDIRYFCCGVPIGYHYEVNEHGVLRADYVPRDFNVYYPNWPGIDSYLGRHLTDLQISTELMNQHYTSGGEIYPFMLNNAFQACPFIREAFTKKDYEKNP